MKAKNAITYACVCVALLLVFASLLLAYPLRAPDISPESAPDPQCRGGKPPPCPAPAPATKNKPPTRRIPSAKKPSRNRSKETGPISYVFEPDLMKVTLNPTRESGTISGESSYLGSITNREIDTSADEACGHMNPHLLTEETVVKNGKLANVFVYVKDGTTADGKKLEDLHFNVPTSEAALDQRGCSFVPRVLGLQVNQTLKIKNRDPTTHNIHFTPKNNPAWNQTLASDAPHIEHRFAHAEIMLPVRDNQHPWMKAYIGVLTHPLYAVTNSEGSFEIRSIPPGTYTLVAWHEGGINGYEKIIQVTVK